MRALGAGSVRPGRWRGLGSGRGGPASPPAPLPVVPGQPAGVPRGARTVAALAGPAALAVDPPSAPEPLDGDGDGDGDAEGGAPGIVTRAWDAVAGGLHDRVVLSSHKVHAGVEAASAGKVAAVAASATALAGGGAAALHREAAPPAPVRAAVARTEPAAPTRTSHGDAVAPAPVATAPAAPAARPSPAPPDTPPQDEPTATPSEFAPSAQPDARAPAPEPSAPAVRADTRATDTPGGGPAAARSSTEFGP